MNNGKNMDNSYLFEYLKKENEELRRLNNSYKQIIDTLFYFLNNISRKYPKLDKDKNNKNNLNSSSELFDLSKDLDNIEDLSKKLISLQFLINNDKDKNKDKENDSDSDNDNKNNKNNKNNNGNNKKNNINKLKPPLLLITKENSIQLPKVSKLQKFNDLIEGMNEKCFSFKNDNFIEKYKNNDNNNMKNNKNDKNNKNNKYDKNDNDYNKNKNKNNSKNKINEDNNNNKDLDKDLIDRINNESDRCVACLLGCNVTKRGYSPMRYNPYEKNVLRVDDCGDLLDRYNELKEKEDNNIIKKEKNENQMISKSRNNSNDKMSKSRDNSKKDILNNSRSNSKIKVKKKIWKY